MKQGCEKKREIKEWDHIWFESIFNVHNLSYTIEL